MSAPNENAMKAELGGYYMTKGISKREDIEAQIVQDAAKVDPEAARIHNLDTDIKKAYYMMQIATGKLGAQPIAPTQSSGPVIAQPTSSVSAAEQRAINEKLLAQQPDMTAVSRNSDVKKLILDRPAPSTYIDKGTKGIIVSSSWTKIIEKINNGTYVVMPDDGEEIKAEQRIASTTNFNLLKAAAEAPESNPVDVYIGGASTRPIGYRLVKGNITGQGTREEQVTREQAKQFVTLEAGGFILAKPTTPGLKLRYIAGKSDPTKPGVTTPGHVVLVDCNKKAAIEAGAVEYTRKKSGEKAEATAKSQLCFRVEDHSKTPENGQSYPKRTIRVSLKAELPVLVRSEEYKAVFGDGNRNANANLTEMPTGDELNKIMNAQRAAIINLRTDALDPNKQLQMGDIASKLKEFEVEGSAAPSSAVL